MIPGRWVRPTRKELNTKLAMARAAVAEGNWSPANLQKQASEFRDFGLFTCEEQTLALSRCLDEITPADYAGQRPPDKSYEAAMKDRELFAFVWESKRFGCKTYLKFAIVRDTVYIVSLHKAKF